MIDFLIVRRGPLLLISLYFIGFIVFIVQRTMDWSNAIDQQNSYQTELAVLESHAAGNAAAGTSSEAAGFAAASQTQAIASFDAFARNTITSSGGVVVSSRSEPSDSTSEPNSIVVSAVFDGKIETVQSILYKLETGLPSIFVDKVAMDPQTNESTSANPELRVSMSMSSLWIAP